MKGDNLKENADGTSGGSEGQRNHGEAELLPVLENFLIIETYVLGVWLLYMLGRP